MGAASAATSLFRTLGGSLRRSVFGSLLTRATEGKAATAGVGSAPTACPQAGPDAYCTQSATAIQQIFLVGSLSPPAFLAAVSSRKCPEQAAHRQTRTPRTSRPAPPREKQTDTGTWRAGSAVPERARA